MIDWWQSLTAANQVFYGAAVFFSVFFVWQFIAALIGLSGGEGDVDVDAGADMDVDADVDVDVDGIEAGSAADAVDTVTAFHLISIRSVLAFFMMFCWAAALYLNVGAALGPAMLYALLWGGASMVLVALVVNLIRRLAETGTMRLSTAVGKIGTVYMEIPARGAGQVRVTVSRVTSYVSARARGGEQLDAGTPIRVVRLLGSNTIEVEPAESGQQGKEPGE